MVQTIDWSAVAAPLILACGALVVLLADAFVGTGRGAHLPAGLSLVSLVAAAVPAVALWGSPRATFCVTQPLTGPPACSLRIDDLTLVVWGVVLFGTAMVTLLGTGSVAEGRIPQGEWHFLLLASATGALTIAAAGDLITLVVALEVVSLPAFALVGLRRGDPAAGEASLKFFLVSVVATAVMLMGVSLLYGATGSVHLTRVHEAVAAGTGPTGVLGVGALLTVVGLGFKVGAVPFHMWVPDTYVGAPVAVAAYLSVVSKAAGFVGLMLVLGLALPDLAPAWSPAVAAMAALTMTVGNVLALGQQHAVRLLAWSSVAQAGYILVPFAAIRFGTGGEVAAAFSASLGYLAAYAVMNLGAFAVATAATARGRRRLVGYRGLIRERPLAGWALAFALVSLAGLPPGVLGLLAKVIVVDAAAGPATWLAVVMAVNVAVGLVYYLRWLAELFRPAEDTTVTAGPAGRARGDAAYRPAWGVSLAIVLTLAAGILFSVLPGLLLDPVLRVLG
ncbi:MAG TPA: NADH-quinone oxidoreductase subunit N [Nocardioidaceae bacterium]|nr:NADH-quinone oxidoreductase subunit N [Nocardioidaceae bacterium]